MTENKRWIKSVEDKLRWARLFFSFQIATAFVFGVMYLVLPINPNMSHGLAVGIRAGMFLALSGLACAGYVQVRQYRAILAGLTWSGADNKGEEGI